MYLFKRIMKSITILLGIILFVGLVACGISDQQSGENLDFNGDVSRVINGDNVVPGEFPWQVQIGYSGADHHCGGSLLSDRWVLTAGHCVYGKSARGFTIVLGEHQRSVNEGTEQVRSIDKIVIHPNFYERAPHYNDVALIRLSSPVRLNNYVQTITLPGVNDNSTGQNAVVTGWGWTRAGSFWGGSNADVLQEGVLPIQNNYTCDSSQKLVRNLKSVEICAGYVSGGQGSCHGDSGGPLVVQKNGKWTLVGVVSWGQGMKCNTYGVFARVSSHISWINSYIDNTPTDDNDDDPQCWEECKEVETGCNTETVCETVCEE